MSIECVMHDAVNNEEVTCSHYANAVHDPNLHVGEALGVSCVLLKVIEKIKNAQEHEVTTHNDNEALVDKTNENFLCENCGLNEVMSVMLEIRRLKQLYEKFCFQWIKGHQEPKKHE